MKKTLLTLGAIAAALALASTPSSAGTIFDDLRDTAPRTVFDDLRDTTPRTVFDDIGETAPVRASDKDLTGE